MSPPAPQGAPVRRRGRLNFTGLQFVLFAGAALIGLAALLAAGLALGLAMAGAAMIAAAALLIWMVIANLGGAGRRTPKA